MKAVLFVIACFLVAAFAASPLTESQNRFLFTAYVQKYQKTYETEDFFDKYETFKSNLDLIIAHNAKANETYKMAVNKFADLTTEEFGQFLGLRTEVDLEGVEVEPQVLTGEYLTASPIDWRTKGVVTGVKNQGGCGSCYAFSAISALESRHALATGRLQSLSEQQIVDCAGSYGNHGCSGGAMPNVYQYLMHHGGACSTNDYPYTARQGGCRGCSGRVGVKGYTGIAGNPNSHIDALQHGPVTTAVAASSAAFQFYHSGVVTNCNDNKINHGVTIVGWSGNHYIVRNSWGPGWGEGGYINLAFGQCAVGTSGLDIFPLV